MKKLKLLLITPLLLGGVSGQATTNYAASSSTDIEISSAVTSNTFFCNVCRRTRTVDHGSRLDVLLGFGRRIALRGWIVVRFHGLATEVFAQRRLKHRYQNHHDNNTGGHGQRVKVRGHFHVTLGFDREDQGNCRNWSEGQNRQCFAHVFVER